MKKKLELGLRHFLLKNFELCPSPFSEGKNDSDDAS